MRNIFLGLLSASMLLLLACNVENELVLIRVENSHNLDFHQVLVNSNEYGIVKAGEKSDYKIFETAYSYGYIRLEVEGDTLIYQPIDFVGETPLSTGKYTYDLTVDTSFQKPYQINLAFRKD